MSNERKFTIEYLDEYIRQGEPDKKEKAYIWQTAIGLQKEMSAYEWAKGHSGALHERYWHVHAVHNASCSFPRY